MDNDVADTMKFRRDNKKRGQYGTNWYLFPNGVPPEDDNDDYEWNGSYWYKVFDKEYD